MLFWQPYTENFRAPVQRNESSGFTRYEADTFKSEMLSAHVDNWWLLFIFDQWAQSMCGFVAYLLYFSSKAPFYGCTFWEAKLNNSWTQWRKLGGIWLANLPALGTEDRFLLAERRSGIPPEAGGGSLAGFTDRQTMLREPCWCLVSHQPLYFGCFKDCD